LTSRNLLFLLRSWKDTHGVTEGNSSPTRCTVWSGVYQTVLKSLA
jgi:hypothetical protein